MARYPDTSLVARYEERKDVVVATPVVGFIRDLRNYALHRALPFIGHSLSWTREGNEFMSEVQISTDGLRQWDGWKAVAKRYLQEAGATVDLREAIREHAAEVEKMWKWIFDQYPALHRIDIVGFNELVNESNWYLSGGTEGRPRRGWAISTGEVDQRS